MSDSKPTGSSGPTPGSSTPKAGSGATDPKPVPPAPGFSASAPPASSSGPKPVAPTPGSSTSAPPVGGPSGSKPVPPAPGSSASAPPAGSSGPKPVPPTSGSSSSSPANSPNPGAAASGSSCPKPPATISAPPGASSSCPSGTGSAGAHPVAGSGPTASISTPPPSPAASSKGGNEIDLVGTGLSSSTQPAGASPIPTLDLASNASTSSPMPNATFPPRFVPALGSGGRPSYARSRSMFQSAPGRSGSAVRPPLFYQQMLSPPPTPNMGSSGRRPVGPYDQMGPPMIFSPSPMEDPYGAGGGSQSGESRDPRQIPAVQPGFQDNYGFGSHSRESRGLQRTASCPPSFGRAGSQSNYGPGGGSQSGESRGPRQPFAGAGSFGAPGSGGGARPNTALGPFAFLSGPINWQSHPLAVNFASLLRSYLNRNGYRDGVSDPNYGARQSYGSTGRWNSAGSRGVLSGYPQGGTPPYPPPDY